MIKLNMSRKLPVAMTIAGSDSGGGAGIQADLKTFAAFQVHGTSAITAITAQNTYSVTGVQAIDLDIIEKQIRAVVEDMGVDAAKTGMLYNTQIITRVAEVLNDYDFPLVVDPVMVAKSGADLLLPEAVEALVEKLLPRALVVTPNRREAEKLSGISINDLKMAKEAAKEIASLGPEGVIVKGGHISGSTSTDVFYYEGEFHLLESPRYDDKTTHGTGCSFSAAIAAGLARGYDVVEAVKEAKVFISNAIRYGLLIGKGYGPVNPMTMMYREASRYATIRELSEFLNWLSKLKDVGTLVPEVGMNVAYSTIYPLDTDDIAAVPGRIRRMPYGGIIFSTPEYGSSDHLSRYLLKIREYDESIRVVVNIRYDENYISRFREMGLKVSYYDRRMEPEEIKNIEGATVPWGVEQAVKNLGNVPDVIYHKGDIGKEPMVVFFSRSLEEAKKIIKGLLGGEEDEA
jgi:hydroxymethylpyrimidine/phosphomethylpyrimidine kinase